jgi:hypothetical protein
MIVIEECIIHVEKKYGIRVGSSALHTISRTCSSEPNDLRKLDSLRKEWPYDARNHGLRHSMDAAIPALPVHLWVSRKQEIDACRKGLVHVPSLVVKRRRSKTDE